MEIKLEMKCPIASLILLAGIYLAGCSLTQPVPSATVPPAASTPLRATATITRTPRPTPLPTYTRTATATISPSPTPVPEGIFALKFYPPTAMRYDPQTWRDRSEYDNSAMMVNHLQARNLKTCTIGPMGPSGFFPLPDKTIQLGENSFGVTLLDPAETADPQKQTAVYINSGLLADYAIVLAVTADQAQWAACQPLAEEVLATLHLAPGNGPSMLTPP